ncbi:uncharacterized protein LOC119386110 [Rhipicephalus sanguineus]|uniref:Uncharacterized protein n=1 Tax=Rhipicephalus sanguineus TaxID=34632 RepID=A0A9D4Q1S4_RHISA|nr:uncharacterized protein LOC119386110 [Rhipicephalus sanguineus]KAH7962838.1 hypothetical protein HPB52_018183 [Rhipicephalus sanguineus]
MSRGRRSFFLLCGLLALGLKGALCDHGSDSSQQDHEQQLLHHNSHQQPPSTTHQQLKAERSGTYYLHDVDNKARFGVAGVGGSGLTLLLPILLVLGLFVIIIPIFGLLFTTGLAGGFGGGGFGAGVPGGLYPAASAAGRKWVGADSPLLSQENVIKMVSYVDKALQDFGKQFKNKQS